MDVRAFCRQSRVLIVAGKGGVGKTTMVAALAHLAAGAGLSVLVVELEGRPGVAAAFGSNDALDYAGSVLNAAGAAPAGSATDGDRVAPGTVRARYITPDEALLEYLADHGLRRISKRLVSSGIIDVVASAIPGVKDILVLGKVKQMERDEIADLILLDAPATGHAMTFLSSARGLLDAARGGPIRSQATDVVELLTDPARCQVVLVTLAEEMPINEAIEAAYALEDRIGIALGPVIVNACDPENPPAVAARDVVAAAGVAADPDVVAALEAARAFRSTRADLQAEQLERLGRELPLAQLRVGYVAAASIGKDEIEILSRDLALAIRELPEPGAERS